ATHHGAFDLAFLRPIPDLIISAPMNERELRNLMFTAQSPENNVPFGIRYPRGRGVTPRWKTPLEIQPIGKGACIYEGGDTAILSIGHIGNNAKKAIEMVRKTHPEKNFGLYNMIYLKPLDTGLLHEVFTRYRRVFTLEDGMINGGLASAVCEFAAQNGYRQELIPLGLPDRFISHGSVADLQKACGLDAESIARMLLQ
ncbi:MAG: 1-deoxy-D-xylulose-5-phosphate synthase, partial [Bacteroidales bacterium]|nr:1-deoxy-D-xylulose-5-phosphate synthase [Bacteroidales bacterium]